MFEVFFYCRKGHALPLASPNGFGNYKQVGSKFGTLVLFGSTGKIHCYIRVRNLSIELGNLKKDDRSLRTIKILSICKFRYN